ncbi:(E)-beta-ocimene synthase, chloroplastic [Tanacetum coccineum]
MNVPLTSLACAIKEDKLKELLGLLCSLYYCRTNQDEIDKDKSPNAISCYMYEHGVSEEVSREHVKTLIDKAWMKMIEAEIVCSEHMTDPLIDMAINLARKSKWPRPEFHELEKTPYIELQPTSYRELYACPVPNHYEFRAGPSSEIETGESPQYGVVTRLSDKLREIDEELDIAKIMIDKILAQDGQDVEEDHDYV